MPETGDRPHWYALRTRSRHEKQVREWLAKQEIERLLPSLVRVSQWKDRKKAIEVPLFPGYCFARFYWHDRLAVLKIPGVVQIVGGGSSPEPVPDEEIEALKKLMISTLPYDAHPYLREGMAIEVIRGPLEGVRGILLRKEKRYRLVISVHLIKQAAAVEIDAGDIAPV
nr:UpxY family transcription antiterminator [Nitrospirota bacterium]